uniref:coronatine-insensitive protein 1-like n=1 Tax=Erigeron canadensis TaxID=72917 RepID=UPI001CB9C342|nr:coronatine-insensitive protein 1-like [Erigeron canadensis]
MDRIVFRCVMPYICDGEDRKSFSLVCREWYELDYQTRQQLAVQLFYATTLLSRLSKRFPFIKHLKLEGLKYFRALDEPLLDVTVWMKELVTYFDYLENLHLRYVQVEDENLELLAKTRGKQLRRLCLYDCDKLSTDGLKHICHHCINLTTLNLGCDQIIIKDAEWLHELALHNTCLEKLIFSTSQSLKRVNITSKFSTVDLKDFFNSAVLLEDFDGCRHHSAKTEDYAGFKYPPNMKLMEFDGCALKDELGLVIPFAHQLIELDLLI